jgi:hypothetical protein
MVWKEEKPVNGYPKGIVWQLKFSGTDAKE